ncbi:MAG TPA: enoyl-CoA hydratase/isomerase family protein [Giesbergeria sp.]|nr:enoyl-CoA hydratase/isomerase family protein [Giesbergeria sp.]HOZ93643.1 enoyl-CoA hydratase/isomerase family protein [Ottowia sp.]HQO52233.1 enoyl-CoA hydratase/isomerase family protein [Ottowia sp.]
MTVHYMNRGPAAWIVLDRPEALNALDFGMLEELAQAMQRADADPDARVVVLTGQGRAFCAGGDIAQLRADMEAAPGQPSRYVDAVERGFDAVRALSKPLVGCVNGVAVGGGLELLLCCDLVIAARTARIGDGHANYGIFPGGGSSALLPRALPINLARHLLFTGALWPAARWHELGLVNQLADLTALEQETQTLAEDLARKSPRLLARLKQTINTCLDKPLAQALRDELGELRSHMQSADMREGTSAFLEKRTPLYSGN